MLFTDFGASTCISSLKSLVIGELLLDVVGVTLFLKIIEGVGAHDSEVDSLEEQDVSDALHGAATDDPQHAEIVAVIERGSEVRAELHVRFRRWCRS